MRELTDFELSLVSGGFGGCDEASGEEIISCGYPPPDPPSYPPSPPPPGSYEPPVGSPPSSGSGPETPCGDAHADKAADNARNLTNVHPSHDSKEFLSALYKDANGDIKTFGPVQGNQVGLLGTIWEFPGFYTDFATQTGMTRASIVGEVHNHPFDVYGHEAALNRYPSSADWASADRAIAAGANPASYSLYVIDTNGEMREFPYELRGFFDVMGAGAKREGFALPPAMTTVPTPTCG